MKLTFSQKDLQTATQVMQNIVNPTTSLAILRNVLLDVAADGNVTFLASDLEAYARVTLAAKSDGSGQITLPARTFADIVKELPPADVAISTKGTKATIKCDEIDYQLATMPADDFPDWPEFSPVTSLTLSQDVLREALERVSCAIPARDPRKVLLGACFDLRSDGLRLVATDGKKLVLVKLPVEGVEGKKEHTAIVPSKIVNEVVRQLEGEEPVKVQFGERQVAFDTGNVLYVSNVIEGEYPRYEMVIPKEFEREVDIARDPLLADLRRASIVQDKNEYGVTLKFEKNALVVSSRGHELGTFEGSIPVKFGESKFEIIFNYSFLQDLLKAADGETITLKMNAPSTPAIMHVDGSEDATFLLMPIKATDYEPAGGGAGGEDEEDEDYYDEEEDEKGA